jgi:hypothetical protein
MEISLSAILKKFKFWGMIFFLASFLFAGLVWFGAKKFIPSFYEYSVLVKTPKNPFSSFTQGLGLGILGEGGNSETSFSTEAKAYLEHQYMTIKRGFLDKKPYLGEVIITDNENLVSLQVFGDSPESAKEMAHVIFKDLEKYFSIEIQSIKESFMTRRELVNKEISGVEKELAEVEHIKSKVGANSVIFEASTSLNLKRVELKKLLVELEENLSDYKLHNAIIAGEHLIHNKPTKPPVVIISIFSFIFCFGFLSLMFVLYLLSIENSSELEK